MDIDMNRYGYEYRYRWGYVYVCVCVCIQMCVYVEQSQACVNPRRRDQDPGEITLQPIPTRRTLALLLEVGRGSFEAA